MYTFHLNKTALPHFNVLWSAIPSTSILIIHSTVKDSYLTLTTLPSLHHIHTPLLWGYHVH